MAGKPSAMFICQGDGCAPAKLGMSLLAETRRELRPALVVEGHKRAVECGIPQRGEEEAVVHVEPFRVGLAFRPGDDVRGTK